MGKAFRVAPVADYRYPLTSQCTDKNRKKFGSGSVIRINPDIVYGKITRQY